MDKLSGWVFTGCRGGYGVSFCQLLSNTLGGDGWGVERHAGWVVICAARVMGGDMMVMALPGGRVIHGVLHETLGAVRRPAGGLRVVGGA